LDAQAYRPKYTTHINHLLKNAVFWDVTPCGSCKNPRFGGTHRFHHHGEKNQHSELQLLVTANAVTSLLILFILIMEAIRSSETLVLTRATWHHIPEDGILHSHRRENLKTYIAIC
jgi:hypothetical protein